MVAMMNLQLTTKSNSKSPRIGLVAASLEILGGQGIQARALCEQLTLEGYKVRFVPINPRFPATLRKLRNVRFVRTVFNQLFYLPSLFVLRRVDVVHVFSASYWSFLLAPMPAMVVGKIFRKRVVLHYHSGEAEDHLAKWGWLVHPWLHLADEIIVPSKYLQSVFSRYGYRTHVVQNLLNLRDFPYRMRMPLKPKFLSMRNLEPHYGIDTVIKTFAIIKRKCPDATLVVAGYGGEEPRLKQLAAELKINGIHFAGRVEPPSVPALYAGADIFLNATTVDNQPVSVLEAFAAGLSVVTTGTGDLAEMVCHGAAGLVVPAANPRAMARAALSLLNHPERAARMTRRAKTEVERYTWPRVAARWAAVYRGDMQ